MFVTVGWQTWHAAFPESTFIYPVYLLIDLFIWLFINVIIGLYSFIWKKMQDVECRLQEQNMKATKLKKVNNDVFGQTGASFC